MLLEMVIFKPIQMCIPQSLHQKMEEMKTNLEQDLEDERFAKRLSDSNFSAGLFCDM